jgi:hypothetical protein
MTIPTLIAFSLLFGASVAYAARVQIRTLQRHLFTTRYFLALMMLEILIVVPVGIYSYVFYSDWSWMYLVNSATINRALEVMAIAAYPVSAVMGYLVGYYSARSGTDFISVLFMGFLALGLLGLFIAAKSQFLWVGTYEQFHRNVGLKFITATSLIQSSLLAMLCILVCWIHLMYRFIKEGRMTSQSF